jgi:hypothetical protein
LATLSSIPQQQQQQTLLAAAAAVHRGWVVWLLINIHFTASTKERVKENGNGFDNLEKSLAEESCLTLGFTYV